MKASVCTKMENLTETGNPFLVSEWKQQLDV